MQSWTDMPGYINLLLAMYRDKSHLEIKIVFEYDKIMLILPIGWRRYWYWIPNYFCGVCCANVLATEGVSQCLSGVMWKSHAPFWDKKWRATALFLICDSPCAVCNVSPFIGLTPHTPNSARRADYTSREPKRLCLIPCYGLRRPPGLISPCHAPELLAIFQD